MSGNNPFEFQSTADAVRLVSEAVAASDFRRASEIADAALAQGLIDVALYNARALWLERQGHDADALNEFERARSLAPRSWAILNAIGLCLTRLHRPREALETFDEAIRINPAYGPSHHRRGVVLGMLGRARETEESHRRAVSLDPRNAEALASLAASEARKGDFAAAERTASRALVLEERNVTAQAAMALVELDRGDCAAAERRLKPLARDASLTGTARAVILGILGDALDAEDRCSEAFTAYAAANAELRAIHERRFSGNSIAGLLDQLIDWLGSTTAESWARGESGPPEQPVRTHVFLVGFYRSGTTLLEQILAAHPDVATIEERDLLAEAGERFLTGTDALERLMHLEDTEMEAARAAYWRSVRQLKVPLDGKVFVDKHPLNTAKLPLIRRLFPGARIVFALRDPRDVVLSCFRRHFEINAAMYELLTLEGAALFYDRTMTFAGLCREKLSFNAFDFRYEDLLSDFEGSVRALCGFLDLPYSESMKDFAAKAAARDIRSPSAAQVRRALTAETAGRWRFYEAELAPVLPLLERWVKRYGYCASVGSLTSPSAP
jgi:Tfp pilus assembly protein PilF